MGMEIFGLVLLFAAIAAFDVPKLARERRLKEFGVYVGVWGLALALSILQALRVPMGNPNQAIVILVDWMTP